MTGKQTPLKPELLAGTEAARLVVVEWIEENSAQFCIPSNVWGHDLLSAIRNVIYTLPVLVAAASLGTATVTTVTTEAEYAALPIGAVVRGNQHGQVAERVDEEGDRYRWVYTGYSAGFSAFEHKTIARDLGTATVLYVPAIP
jgi:hypothetical protein